MKTDTALDTLHTARAAASLPTRWKIDPAHVTAQFSVRHMMVSTVRGQFDKVSGETLLDEADLTQSSVSVEIETASIDTREPKRDEHLRSPDFFDAASFPTIRFRSTRIERAPGGGFTLTGTLEMRGVTKPVALHVEGPGEAIKNPWGQLVRGVSVTGKLHRRDWGLNWNAALEAGGFLVGDEITLQIDLELNPA